MLTVGDKHFAPAELNGSCVAVPNSHSRVDVDPCSFLAVSKPSVRFGGEDSESVTSRGNGEMNCLSKGSSIVVVREDGRT